MLNEASRNTTQKDLTALFQGLFPTWPTILATMLAVTVLFIVLTKFLWKPMKKYVNDRHTFIQVNIDSAIKKEIEATNSRKAALKELDAARVEADQIINNARMEALNLRKEMLDESKQQSKQILEAANAEILRNKLRLKHESKQEIVSIALDAAKKIIGENVDSKTNRKIIEDYIKQNDK